jgi:hypothetical protein
MLGSCMDDYAIFLQENRYRARGDMYWSLDSQYRFRLHFSISSVNSTVSRSVILPCHISLLFLGNKKNARQIKTLGEFIIFILSYKTHPTAALILLSVNTFKPVFQSSIPYI